MLSPEGAVWFPRQGERGALISWTASRGSELLVVGWRGHELEEADQVAADLCETALDLREDRFRDAFIHCQSRADAVGAIEGRWARRAREVGLFTVFQQVLHSARTTLQQLIHGRLPGYVLLGPVSTV